MRFIKKIIRNLKTFWRRKFFPQLSKQELRGYRNILKLLYHKNAIPAVKDVDSIKWYIRVPILHLDLIITLNEAEIINTEKIYPLILSKETLERAIKVIRGEAVKQRILLEQEIKFKKENIFNKIFNKIK